MFDFYFDFFLSSVRISIIKNWSRSYSCDRSPCSSSFIKFFRICTWSLQVNNRNVLFPPCPFRASVVYPKKKPIEWIAVLACCSTAQSSSRISLAQPTFEVYCTLTGRFRLKVSKLWLMWEKKPSLWDILNPVFLPVDTIVQSQGRGAVG